jgi:ParB family chromosome partitioning protein
MALVENIQRLDLDPIEISLSYQRLIDEINLTQEQLSERIGKNRSTIANYLRLLKLDPIIQTGMRDGFMSMGHGRALINVNDPQKQLEIYEKILQKSLSVRETEQLVREVNEGSKTSKTTKKTAAVPTAYKKGIKEFSEYLGTKVDVKVTKKGSGKLSIPFSSEEDFIRLKKLIQGED